jgi:hypothetical protein
MSYKLEVPVTITLLRTKVHEHWNIGLEIGVILYHISPLLLTHLDNAIDYRSRLPTALLDVCEIVPALDAYISHLRMTDGCSDKFTDDDRKGKRYGGSTQRDTSIWSKPYLRSAFVRR